MATEDSAAKERKMNKKDNLIDKNDLLDFEDEVTAKVQSGAVEESAPTAEQSVTPDIALSDTPVDLPVADPAAPEAPVEAKAEEVASAPTVEPAPVEAPTAPDPAPVPEEPQPQYGAPGMLFEDVIPSEFRRNEPQPEPEPEPQPEPEPPKEEKKKKTKEDELLAEVEAEMAARAQEPPKVQPIPVVVAQQPTPQAQEEKPVKQETKPSPQQPREFSEYEQKLRQEYKMEEDLLLSDNTAVPGFVIAKGENVIRTYSCLDSARGEGTICLTNKRLLINTDECVEVGIERITGTKFCRYWTFSFIKFFFGLLFFLVGAAMFALPFVHESVGITGDSWKAWYQYFFLGCGAVLILLSLPFFLTMVKKYFYFLVYAQESAPFFEVKSKTILKREKKGDVYKFVVASGSKESEKAARELGALIIEAKDGRYDF